MDKKTKLLIINSHKSTGGAARIAENMHLELRDKGYDVKTLYGRDDSSEDSCFVKIESDCEIYYSALMTRLTGKVGLYNKRATKRVIDIIEDWKPDVIHLHNVHGYWLNIPMLFDALAKKEIPVVWTLHDCFPFTGKCGYHFECDKWKSGCGNCPMLKNYPKVLKDRTEELWQQKKDLFTAIDKLTIVTPSDWLTKEAKESFLGKYKCLTVRNGIDTKNIFYPRDRHECRQKYGFNDEDKIILGIAIGFSDPRKGAKYIVELARHFESKAKVVLVGWEKQNDKMIEGLTNVITVPTVKDSHKLAEYYSIADVFVIPSLAENYATTTIEAMACGTLVVGFNAGGIPEQITEGRGVCVEVGNQKALNDAVEEILGSRGDYKERSELAKEIDNENSIQKMVDEYIKLY